MDTTLLHFKSFHVLVWGGGTGVERLPRHSKVEGSSPATVHGLSQD